MADSLTWVDLTIRPEAAPEVELQPDDTVEVTWPMTNGSRLTILLRPDDARVLSGKLGLRLLMVGEL